MPSHVEQQHASKGAENETVPVGLRGLGKDYGSFTALRSLDLNVPDGICFGFLGPNGAGKTTTIKIMTNLIRPTRGRATLFGIDVHREPRRAGARPMRRRRRVQVGPHPLRAGVR